VFIYVLFIYNDVRPQFKPIETEQDLDKLTAAETKQAFLHPNRLREITQYILNNFRQKTQQIPRNGVTPALNIGKRVIPSAAIFFVAEIAYEPCPQFGSDVGWRRRPPLPKVAGLGR
jgi:hypothetical protein